MVVMVTINLHASQKRKVTIEARFSPNIADLRQPLLILDVLINMGYD